MNILYVLISVLVVLLCLYYRDSKIVISLVSQAIIDVERELNTKKGQDKLDEVVVRVRQSLPYYISIFITKSKLIDIIEFMFSILNKAFKLNRDIDIKGNERDFSININEGKSELSYTIEHRPNYDDNFLIYGKLKADTDFKGNNNASVEIGFQKKF